MRHTAINVRSRLFVVKAEILKGFDLSFPLFLCQKANLLINQKYSRTPDFDLCFPFFLSAPNNREIRCTAVKTIKKFTKNVR